MKNTFLIWFFFILQICVPVSAVERIVSADVVSGQISIKNLLGDKGHFEKNAVGWSGYDDAAAVPVDGTGGTVTTTCTRTTSTPLSGIGSFLYTPAALGEGCSTPFTVETKDTAGTVLQVSFDYSVVSGTYTDDDTQIWIYDVTAGVMIQPAPYKLKKHTLTSQPFALEFQTTSASTSYRLLIHQATSGTAILKIDNITIGKQAKLYGSAVTDWADYTPTGSWSSNVTYTGKWRKVGDSMEIQAKVLCSGAPTSAGLYFSMPAGYSMDTSKLVSGVNTLGIASMQDSGVASYIGEVQFISADQLYVYTSASPSANVTQAVPFTFGANDYVTISVLVPIVGWSSSQVVSSDAATQVIAMTATGSSTSLTKDVSTDVAWTTTTRNDGGALFDGTTYTIATPGWYEVSAAARLDATYTTGQNNFLDIKRNGTSIVTMLTSPISSTTTDVIRVNKQFYFNAADAVKATVTPGGVSPSISSQAAYSHFNIKRISGPSQIMASDTVAALYTGAPPTGTLTSSYNTTTFGTKVKDTGGNYASGTYTVPISGVYDISAQTGQSATYSLGNVAITGIFIDGVQKYVNVIYAAGAVGIIYPLVSTKSIPLLAGQLVTIKSYNTGSSAAFTSDATTNYFSIVRSGNY